MRFSLSGTSRDRAFELAGIEIFSNAFYFIYLLVIVKLRSNL